MSSSDGRTHRRTDAPRMAGWLRASARLCLCASILAACDHAQPFGVPDLDPNQPFSTTYPRRLTFNSLGDVQAAWLPGDTGIIYSWSAGPPNGNHCLGILPPGGGHLTATFCGTSPADADSTVALWQPAPGPRFGRLAYQRDASAIAAFDPNTSQLLLASLGAPSAGRVLLTLPYTAQDGSLVGAARDLQWLSSSVLVYRAGSLTFTGPPLPVDTLFSPIEIARLGVVGDSASLSIVPGTSGATSLATDTASALYFTLPGDSRVYRMPDGAPAAAAWYDFGAMGVPTLIRVAGDGGNGSVLVALVGSTLYAVHIGAGAPVPLTLPPALAVSSLALARSARFAVVEGSLGGAPDLWLVQVP